MITQLHLEHFKAFETLRLEPATITILVGPNNAGKSSITAALRLLVQTHMSADPTVPLLLNGVMGDFGTFKDVVFGNHRARPFVLDITVSNEREIPRGYPAGSRFRIRLEYKYRTTRREVILRTCELRANDHVLLKSTFSKDTLRHSVDVFEGVHLSPHQKPEFSRSLAMEKFLPFMRLHPLNDIARDGEGLFELESLRDAVRRMRFASYALDDHLRDIDYLGPMRLPPERTYLFTGERRSRIGVNGEHTAAILAMETPHARGRKSGPSLLLEVNQWLAKAGIAKVLDLAALSDRHYEIRLTHPITGEAENLADTGYGGSQVLPVLVGGFSRPEGSTFIVEEPEIHLHPRAQAELGSFFLRLHERRVQTFIETHSEYLILRLQEHVAKGDLPANDVCIYYIDATATGGKKALRIGLKADGTFDTPWPRGFFPERLEAAKAIARARSRRGTTDEA